MKRNHSSTSQNRRNDAAAAAREAARIKTVEADAYAARVVAARSTLTEQPTKENHA